MSVTEEITLVEVWKPEDLPSHISMDDMAQLFHHKMEPFNDTLEDVHRALDYAFVPGKGQGGHMLLALRGGKEMVGAVLFLKTGMKGYIPENILLMIVVDPSLRGQGVGRKLMDHGLGMCEGDVKLHVEHDNPAQHLYQRVGFTSKYLEMRYSKK
jgi:ribosomal protein S18 acetylase RimI-like enzyme